jgi:hypothetical protein
MSGEEQKRRVKDGSRGEEREGGSEGNNSVISRDIKRTRTKQHKIKQGAFQSDKTKQKSLSTNLLSSSISCHLNELHGCRSPYNRIIY